MPLLACYQLLEHSPEGTVHFFSSCVRSLLCIGLSLLSLGRNPIIFTNDINIDHRLAEVEVSWSNLLLEQGHLKQGAQEPFELSGGRDRLLNHWLCFA